MRSGYVYIYIYNVFFKNNNNNSHFFPRVLRKYCESTKEYLESTFAVLLST